MPHVWWQLQPTLRLSNFLYSWPGNGGVNAGQAEGMGNLNELVCIQCLAKDLACYKHPQKGALQMAYP